MALFEDINRKTIPLKHMENAINLITYYLKERIRMSGLAEPNLDLEKAQELLKWINKKKLGLISLPDVYRAGPRVFRNKKQAIIQMRLLIGIVR